jgi:hypothetical protein
MEILKNIISQLDGRILQLDINRLFEFDYLFEPTPKTMGTIVWAVTLTLLVLLINSFLVWYTKRPKKKLAKQYRFILRKWSKINIALLSIILLYLFFRTQQFIYLSMRFILIILIVCLVINIVYASIKIIKVYRNQDNMPINKEKIAYSDYLPKKKKKK